MTPEQLRLVESTVSHIEDQSERFSVEFIDALVWTAPDIRTLLPTDATELAELRRSIVAELAFLANTAGDLPVFVRRARRLGAINHRRGGRLEHFAASERALITALTNTLGDTLTPEAERAWRRLYRLITETMLEGAACEQFRRKLNS